MDSCEVIIYNIVSGFNNSGNSEGYQIKIKFDNNKDISVCIDQDGNSVLLLETEAEIISVGR